MTETTTITSLLGQAGALEKDGKFAEALECYQNLPLDKVDVGALTVRITYLAFKSSQPFLAQQAAERLAKSGMRIREEHRDQIFHNLTNGAAMAGRQGRTEEAIALYRAAAAMKPDSPEVDNALSGLCFRSGDSFGAEEAWRRVLSFTEAETARHPLADTGLRFFRPNWMTSRIGEIVHQLDLHVKASRLGWLPPMHCVLLADERTVCNRAMLDYWKPLVPVVTAPSLIEKLQPLAGVLPYNPILIRMPDGNVLHKMHAHKLVQREWERKGMPPLLQVSRQHHEEGWQALERFGMRRGDWFVCLHMREPGYLKEVDGSHSQYHRYRNVSIASFMPAVEEIVRRGGWVVRVGDPSMTPLPPMERVIDYALSDVRCDWMDMFLCGENRFFLGTSSGLVLVAMAFGKPTIMTNMTPVSQTSYAGQDIFLSKMYRERATGRLLGFDESLRPPLRDLLFGDTLETLGYETIENTDDDILDATVEMLDRLDGRPVYSDDDEALQNRLRELFAKTDNIIAGRMGRAFLRRHRDLL